jgi:hypothetical protein
MFSPSMAGFFMLQVLQDRPQRVGFRDVSWNTSGLLGSSGASLAPVPHVDFWTGENIVTQVTIVTRGDKVT